MGDETKFSEKWDFRRKENSFDDSSTDDDPVSNSTQNLIIHSPNLVLDPNQLENGTETVTGKQPPKTRKRRSKKGESKPEKAKQVRVRKPKTVCAEENKKKEETVSPTDDVRMFMKTLIDDLTASRESLMEWVETELYGTDQNEASRPPVKKRAVPGVAAQRSVKKRMTKKTKKEEEEKESEKVDNISQEMNKPKEIAQNSGDQVPVPDCTAGPLDHGSYLEMNKSKQIANDCGDRVPALDCNAGLMDSYLRTYQEMNKSREIAQKTGDQIQELESNAGPLDSYLGRSQEMNRPKEITENGGDQVQELDCNTGPLNRFLKSSQDGLGRDYFQQQEEEGQEGILARTEMENEKNEAVVNQKSIVLAIKAPILTESQKKTREANNNKNRSSGSETQKDQNFKIPYVPKTSSLPSLQSYPVAPSFFLSSSQGIISFASNNNNFQMRQPPVVSQITDLSEFQTGFTGGQGFGNSMFNNNGYLSAFHPSPNHGGYNFPAQANPASSLQQRGNNNMFGGLRMAITRSSDGLFPESEVGNGINSLSDYRSSSGR